MQPTEHATHKRLRRRDGHGEDIEEALRSLRDALRAARQGNFSVRLPTEGGDGVMGEVSLAFNALVEENEALIRELARVSSTVNRQGDLSVRATLGPASGSWSVALDAVNSL